MVVDESDGVTNVSLTATGLPPVDVVNQLMVSGDVATSVAEPGPHLETLFETGAAGIELMIALTATLPLVHI